jgi:large subunit ribosomal protein L3
MGMDRVTVQNLKVVAVDEERGLLLVEGAIPGPTGALVYISPAKKRRATKDKKKK